MQVPKINAFVRQFTDWMTTEEAQEYLPYWETQANWQNHFNVEAKDLAGSYDLALDSKTNRRHYRRGGYDPKRSMLAIMEWEPDFVRDAFRDLFSEDRDLEGRIQRFVFYINELFNRYRDAKPKARIPTHYHDDDYNMVSIYLMGQYPEKYAPYSTDLLQTICTNLGAKTVPPAADFPRYTKLLQTLQPFLSDDEITTKYQDVLRDVDYQGESALLMFWFFKFVEQSGMPASENQAATRWS
ncbi:hypothetical protein CLV84_2918 [Neolewinella xylanilytica]|uniref:Uncharacterized protein n=1 Tax=Neolewinella xylanilytica TaxID=1514080 RepID=A0A2S6I4I7_9BACT|nr:hypothetical protein [Neolewinella xylanilytica]PPK86001.1 hypothetical protein CLV84_2918 [Neolewinella xylanilytica]